MKKTFFAPNRSKVTYDDMSVDVDYAAREILAQLKESRHDYISFGRALDLVTHAVQVKRMTNQFITSDELDSMFSSESLASAREEAFKALNELYLKYRLDVSSASDYELHVFSFSDNDGESGMILENGDTFSDCLASFRVSEH